MKKTLNFTKVTIAILIALYIFLSPAVGGVVAYASSTRYTGALEDLQKDEAFNVADYPSLYNDYSFSLIQIAESSDGELFLYVYQPSRDKVTANEVRISTTRGTSLAPRDYKLRFLNRSGTIAKYLVEGLEVKNDDIRYYYIYQISRPYDASLDGSAPPNGYTTETHSVNVNNTTAYFIAKLYTVYSEKGKLVYLEEHNEAIVVTDKWFGRIRYSNGFKLYKDSCDAWFVAFNTDMPIDKLYDADVSYMSQYLSYSFQYGTGKWLFNENASDLEPTGPHVVKLTDKDTAETSADGLFAYKYKWKRIESVDEFKKNEDLSAEYIDNLRGKQWVLRFTETEYGYYKSTYTGVENHTEISEVTILRLRFKSQGMTYNLGVVDNKISNADGPVNNDTEAIDGAKKRLQKIKDRLEAIWDKIVTFFKNFFTSGKKWLQILKIVGIVLAGVVVLAIIIKLLTWAFKRRNKK